MLLVTAQIWPGGDKDRAVEIGRITAENVSDLAAISDYAVEVEQQGYEGGGVAGWLQPIWVSGHRRRLGVWDLVRRITAQLQPTGNDAAAVATTLDRATAVLGSRSATVYWVNRRMATLGNQRPIDLLDTREGIERVMTLLGQIEGGVYI